MGPPSADNCGQVRETRALFVLLSSCCPVFPTSSFYYVSSKLFLSYFSYRLHLPYFTTSSFHPTFVTSYFIPTFQQAVLVLLSNERFLSYFPTSGFCPTFPTDLLCPNERSAPVSVCCCLLSLLHTPTYSRDPCQTQRPRIFLKLQGPQWTSVILHDLHGPPRSSMILHGPP